MAGDTFGVVSSLRVPSLDVLSSLAFSSTSPLYRKLVIEERKVDQMFGYFPDHIDPYLLMVGARVRDPKDWTYVRDELLATCEAMTKQASVVLQSTLFVLRTERLREQEAEFLDVVSEVFEELPEDCRSSRG